MELVEDIRFFRSPLSAKSATSGSRLALSREGRGKAAKTKQKKASVGSSQDDIFDEMDPLGGGEGPKRKEPGPSSPPSAKAPLEKVDEASEAPATTSPGPVSPGGREKKDRGFFRQIRFFLPLLIAVGIPTGLAAYYYGWIATDLYYTETRISVRSPGATAAPSLMSSAMGGIQLGSASIEADSIAEFALSHDAVEQLENEIDLRAIFTREEGDFLSRLAADASFEDLVEHYQRRVSVVYDQATGIIQIGAKTYRSDDSHALLVALNGISETLVNAFNKRAEEDALRLARSEVERAEERMAAVRSELLNFRLTKQELDPLQRSGGILTVIGHLEAEYSKVAAEIKEMTGFMNSDSRQVIAHQNRLDAIAEQIKAEEDRLTGTQADGDERYASVLNEYEILTLERELAHHEYVSAIASLETARLEAQRQQVYLVPIVQPHMAETAIYPERLQNVGLIFLASFLVFMIGRLVISGIQDHMMT